MLRAYIIMAIIYVYYGIMTLATDPSIPRVSSDEVIESNEEGKDYYYHPVEHKKPYVIEEFNRQYPDGSYEFKYVLSNGVARYEKAFWKKVGKGKKFLARKGFYSHPLPNHKYIVVFYTADEYGFQQDTKYTNTLPKLPKHLAVAQHEFPDDEDTIITTTTTPKPTTTRRTTTRKPKTTTTQPQIEEAAEFNWIY